MRRRPKQQPLDATRLSNDNLSRNAPPHRQQKKNIIYGRPSPLGNERQVQMTGKDTFDKSGSKFKFEALSAVRYLLYNTIY